MHRFITLAALILLASLDGNGQTKAPIPPAAPAPAPPPEPVDPLGRTTPNGTVLGFLKTATVGDYERAAQYLNTKSKDAPDLAQKLRRVMDAGLRSGLNHVSREPDGDMADGLAANRAGRDAPFLERLERAAHHLVVILRRGGAEFA